MQSAFERAELLRSLLGYERDESGEWVKVREPLLTEEQARLAMLDPDPMTGRVES